MPLVNAFPSRRLILRMMRRERSRSSQFVGVPTNRPRWSCSGLRCGEELRSLSCPEGADRMRAPLAVEANGGSAVRH